MEMLLVMGIVVSAVILALLALGSLRAPTSLDRPGATEPAGKDGDPAAGAGCATATFVVLALAFGLLLVIGIFFGCCFTIGW